MADTAPTDTDSAGIAALVGLDLDNPGAMGPMYERFQEGRSLDPIASCHALLASIEGDWPTHTFTVIANDRARHLHEVAVVRSLGGPE